MGSEMCIRDRGYDVIEIDRRYGFDLLKSNGRNLLLQFLRDGYVSVVHVATPCSSFSRARERGGGPSALRSDDFPKGVPGLTAADQTKVEEGNKLANLSAEILNICYRNGIPCSLENPATSRIWKLTCFSRLLKRKHMRSINLDFCAYGTPWRKRTKLMFAWVDLRVLAHICTSKHGICDFTHKKHQVLEGKKPGTSICWTAIAEPYPRSLCTAWSKCFLNQRVSRALGNLSNILY